MSPARHDKQRDRDWDQDKDQELVAPNSACAALNPELQLALSDPIALRGVEPRGVLTLRLLEGRRLFHFRFW